jgi:copper transport protein
LPAVLAAVLVAALALAFVGVSAAPAAAHAALVASTPAAGASVDRAPAAVSVRFGESVQASSDAIRVLDARGARVDEGDAATVPGHPDTVSAALRPGLGRGTYTVAWRVTSADSHPVHGAFAFSVGPAGTAAVPLAGVDRGADPAVAALVHLARGAGYAGLALLVGAAGTALLLDGTAGRAALRRQTCAGGLVLTVSAALSLLAQGPYAAGGGLGSLLDPDLLRTTLSGRTGVALAVRVLLAAALTLPVALTAPEGPPPRTPPVPLPLPRPLPAKEPAAPALPALGEEPAAPTPPATAPAAVPGVGVRAPLEPLAPEAPRPRQWSRATAYARFVPLAALAATFSATGHPAAGRHVPPAFAADLLHLAAMGLWLGGLVALATLCARGAAVPAETFTAAVRRFSPLAAWCVGVLAVTGVLQSLRELTSVADLLDTGWGRYLLVKLAVVLGLLVLARRARAWTRRRTSPDGPSLRTMRRTLAYEAAAGAVVLALSAMLAGSAPPSDRPPAPKPVAHPAPASPSTLRAPYDTGTPGGSGSAAVVLTSRQDGSTAVAVTLTTLDGTPAKPAELTAALTLPALGLGPLALPLHPTTAGHWTATTTLTPKGTWRLALTVRTSDIDEATVTFTIPPSAN